MKRVQIGKIYSILKQEVRSYRVPIVDLVKVQTADPFKILVATIMSARTNDRQTALAAGRLFSVVKKPGDLRRLSQAEIERLIRPVGFYRNKARFLKMLPDALDAQFGGKVPQTVDQLLKLPGVGRKTANLVSALAFDRHAICVDTHVHRIMNRLGYVRTKTPFDTEMALRKKLPKRYWKTINSIIVAYGQNTCRPIGPKCSRCVIREYCNRIGVKNGK